MSMCSQAGPALRAMRRLRDASSLISMRSSPPGKRIVKRRASKSPSSVPFGASTSMPGSHASRRAVPLSLRSAHQAPPSASAMMATRSASSAPSQRTERFDTSRRAGGGASG